MDKKLIKYYASFYEVSKELTQKQFYEFNSAIFSVMFYERHIDDIVFEDKMLAIAWASIKHSLQASIDGFCSKNGIAYEDTLCKGVTKGLYKGLDKGLTNNVKEKEKEKDNRKENIKEKIEAFVPNTASIDAVNSVYPNCDIQSLVSDFKDQARNRAKPFKDLQSGFRNYVRKGWVKPTLKQNTQLSYSEIKQRLLQEQDNISKGNQPSLDGLVNKMRVL